MYQDFETRLIQMSTAIEKDNDTQILHILQYPVYQDVETGIIIPQRKQIKTDKTEFKNVNTYILH